MAAGGGRIVQGEDRGHGEANLTSPGDPEKPFAARGARAFLWRGCALRKIASPMRRLPAAPIILAALALGGCSYADSLLGLGAPSPPKPEPPAAAAPAPAPPAASAAPSAPASETRKPFVVIRFEGGPPPDYAQGLYDGDVGRAGAAAGRGVRSGRGDARRRTRPSAISPAYSAPSPGWACRPSACRSRPPPPRTRRPTRSGSMCAEAAR